MNTRRSVFIIQQMTRTRELYCAMIVVFDADQNLQVVESWSSDEMRTLYEWMRAELREALISEALDEFPRV